MRISKEVKNDPVKRWSLPDPIFFAAGACHILTYAFLESFPQANFVPIWIKPNAGFRGNHIFARNETLVFDYQGYNQFDEFILAYHEEWSVIQPGFAFTLVELPPEVLISEALSKQYAGLWLREPTQFLHDAIPRARAYLQTFNHAVLNR